MAEASRPGRAPGTRESDPGAERSAVLVVDDDPDATRFLRAVLATRGIRANAAYDAQQGYHLAMEEHPRVILVDWHMPEGGGRELLQLLHQSGMSSTTSIVVITADASPAVSAEATALGAREFLHKPLSPETLLETVARYLDR